MLAQGELRQALRLCHEGLAEGRVGHGDENTPRDLSDSASVGEPGLERDQQVD